MTTHCKILWKAVCCIALIAALSMAICASAENSSPECEHKWVLFTSFLDMELTIEQNDDSSHNYVRSYPKEVCSLCGAYGDVWLASKESQPHAFELSGWSGTEENITMHLKCHLCGYEKDWAMGLEAILTSGAAPCLHGGQCTRGDRGYMDTQGKIVPWTWSAEEQVRLVAVLHNADEQTYQPATRHYCSVCGRPGYDDNLRNPPQTEFNESWNSLPIMSEADFLTVDMPDDLPYQLIDQLRKEAGAA